MDKIDALAEVPLFATLDRSTLRRIASRCATRWAQTGQLLMTEGEAGDEVLLITKGSVSVSRRGVPLVSFEAPIMVGELALFDPKNRRTATVIAAEECELLAIPHKGLIAVLKEKPAATLAMLKVLNEQFRTVMSRVETEAEALDVFFVGDSADPVPGPYIYEDVSMVIAVMECAPRRLRRLLPPPLGPRSGSGELFGILFAHFPDVYSDVHDARHIRYHETSLIVPCSYRHLLPGIYMPYIFCSSLLVTMMSREIYGLRKRYGETMMAMEEGSITTTVQRDTAAVLDWSGSRPVKEGALWDKYGSRLFSGGVIDTLTMPLLGLALGCTPEIGARSRLPVFSDKRIIAPEATPYTPRFDVNEIVASMYEIDPVHELEELEGVSLTLSPTTFPGLSDGTLVAAYRFRSDQRLLCARSLGPASGRWKRFLPGWAVDRV